jgi:hypothetical protein
LISHEWGKDQGVFTASGTYQRSFVTQIFHSGQPIHGGDRKAKIFPDSHVENHSTDSSVQCSIQQNENRYSRACGSYQNIIDRGLLLRRKLLNQGYLLVKLKSSLRKLYGNAEKFTILGEWYPRGIIVHQKRYRPSDSNKNVDIEFSAH